MGSKTETKSSATSAPAAGSQPVLDGILSQARSIQQSPGIFNPVVGPETTQGQDMMLDAARQGSAAVQPLQGLVSGTQSVAPVGFDQIAATARGDNLSGNPFLQGVIDDALNRTENRVNQQFSGAGRYGSAAHTKALADSLGTLELNALMNNYNAERGYQVGAAGQAADLGFRGADAATALDNSRLYGANLFGQVGAARDAAATAEQQAPLAASQYASSLALPIATGFGTQTNTQTQRTPANVPGMIVGAGMTGLGIMSGNPAMASSLFGTPSRPQISNPYPGSYGPPMPASMWRGY